MKHFISKIPAEGKEQIKNAAIAIIVVIVTTAIDSLFSE